MSYRKCKKIKITYDKLKISLSRGNFFKLVKHSHQSPSWMTLFEAAMIEQPSDPKITQGHKI